MMTLDKLWKRLAKLEPGKPFVFMHYRASDGRRRVFCGGGQGICTGSVVAPELIRDLDDSVFDMGPESELLRARLRSALLAVPRGVHLDEYQKILHEEAVNEDARRTSDSVVADAGDDGA